MVKWFFLNFSIGWRYPRNAGVDEAIAILLNPGPWLFIAVSNFPGWLRFTVTYKARDLVLLCGNTYVLLDCSPNTDYCSAVQYRNLHLRIFCRENQHYC